MEIGQRVYVQKTDLQSHKWYEAYIVDIRLHHEHTEQGTVCRWFCCSTLPMEYVVRYNDGSTQNVTLDRIHERLS